MKSWRERAIDGIKAGDTFVFSRRFTKRDVSAFGDVGRDYNPVHYDAGFAKTWGFKGEICHGLLVGGLVCEFGGQVAWLASALKFEFLRPVYVGDTVTGTLKVLSVGRKGFARARARARMVNQDGREVLRAVLEGFLPGERQSRRLAKMVAAGDPTNKLCGERSAPKISKRSGSTFSSPRRSRGEGGSRSGRMRG